MRTLEQLALAIDQARPELLDRWEAAAVVESFGYTDGRVSAAFGFADTLALGEYLVERQERRGRPTAQPAIRTSAEGAAYGKAIVSSLVYALPWLIVFLAEARRPDFLELSSDAAGPMSIALMGSLIVSGGFVQVIARRGQFYLGIQQANLANLTCLLLLYVGLVFAGIVAIGGIFMGWYFSIYTWPFLLLGAAYFIVATILWMQCAILGLHAGGWRIPLIFLVAGAAFAAARMFGLGTLLAQVFAASTAVLCANAQTPRVFGTQTTDVNWQNVVGSNTRVVAHGLAPYFLYGLLYFTFLMVDRINASAAVVALGQGPFAVPRPYKDGMDLALLTFLLAAAAIECCNLGLMRAWRTTGDLPFESGIRVGALQVRRQRARVLLLLTISFTVVACAVRAAAGPLMGRSLSGLADSILIVGDLGYLLLAVGLLNGLTLLSLNRVESVVRALAIGVGVNFLVGGLLSHLIGAYFATAGLTTGAAVFAGLTAREMRKTLADADCAYVGA